MRHNFFDSESSINFEARAKSPTYFAHAYSGGKLFVQQFDFPVVLDLSTVESGPVDNLLRHQPSFKAGSGSIEIFNDRIEAKGELNEPGFARNEIVSSHKSGKAWQVSIGWQLDLKAEGAVEPELVPDGERRQINGRTFVGPFYHARGGRIPEVSFVDRGGDVENHVKLVAKRKTKGVTMEQELIDYGKLLGIPDPTKLDDGAVIVLQASFDSFNEPNKPALKDKDKVTIDFTAELKAFEATLAESRKKHTAEINRQDSIRSICASHGHPNVKIGEGDEAREVSMVAHAIENDWDENKVKLEAKLWELEQDEKKGNETVHQYAGLTMTAEANEYLAAACLLRDPENTEDEIANTFNASHREKIMNEATSGKYREMGLVDLCKLSLQAMGRPFTGLGHGPEFANFVVSEHRRHHFTASVGGATLVSLPNILENTMNKSLMMSFRRTPSTWREIAHLYSASDYKNQSFYRLTMGGGFKRVGDDGQIKHASVSDSKQTAAVEDYGVMLTLTTKMIVNDDMNALASLGNNLGMHAGRAIDEVLYELLLTSGTLFVADRNLITGTPLSYGALQAIDDHFDGILDADNKPIDVDWNKLVVGNGYKRLAQKFARESSMAALAKDSATADAVGEIDFGTNDFAGRFDPVHSKWISPKKAGGAQNPTNTEGKELSTPAAGNQVYFAVAGPGSGSEKAPIRVGHLNGVQTPMVSSGSLSFDVEGIGYKALYNFGVDEGDWEGILKLTSN